jgi:MoaA/NifB/PqqE/SkfB family radical SAM enzyme
MIEYQTIKRAIDVIKKEPGYLIPHLFSSLKFRLNSILSDFLNGYSFSLNTVFFVLTYKCNLRCVMCGLWGPQGLCISKINSQEELSLDIWKKVVSDLKKISPNIILFGGEPLIYKNWYEIAKYIRENNLRCHLPTNGTLIKNNLEKITEVITNVDFSLDGIGEIHEKIRGERGIFEKIIEGIVTLNKYKEEKKLSLPYLNICCTINHLNYSNISEIPEFFEKNNIKINLLNFQNIEFTEKDTIIKQKKFFKENFNSETSFWEGVEKKNFEIDLEILIKEIRKIKSKKYKNIKYIEFEPDFTEEQLKAYYRREHYKIKNKKCLSPWTTAMILPDGEVWICPDYSVGNIKEKNILELFNNEKARKFRRTLIKFKKMPICGDCYTIYM